MAAFTRGIAFDRDLASVFSGFGSFAALPSADSAIALAPRSIFDPACDTVGECELSSAWGGSIDSTDGRESSVAES